MTFRIGTPHKHNAGYFVNDQALRTRQEAHVQTCTHCQAIIKMEEWKHEGGWCAKCQAPLCNTPQCMARTALEGCVPFLARLEREVGASMRFANIRKLAGLDPVIIQPKGP